MSGVLEVRRALRESSRVVLFAGSGVREGRGPVLLRALAERMQCPVMTTPKAKGVFPEDHPLAVGVYGMAGHLSSRQVVDEGVDTLIAIGTSLGELATEGWTPRLQPRRALIQVDVDERQLGRAYPCTIGIVASAEQFCERMLAELPQAPPRHLGGVRRHHLPESTHLIAPQRAILEIQQSLPRNTVFTIDSGEHFMFATHFLETVEPDAFMAMIGLGSMGQSIGAAIGVQLAHPDRVVAALVGDGCFAMNAFEVATAVREGIPILVFVINDQRLGMVELGHAAVYGRRPSYPTAIDVAQIGRALGAQALTVSHPGQILQTDLLRLREKGPVVVDVRIDPSIRMPKKDRMAAFSSAPSEKSLRVVN
jgi:acetolactate synthase-1/2/3 large subunit